MQSFYLNIGLNVGNIEPQTQLSRTVRGLLNNKELSIFNDLKVVESTYQGMKERTLIVSIDNFLDCDILHLQTIISMLAKDLKQESIALYHPDHAVLIYNPDYKGEKLVFDMQYFKF
jgi:hypothetical protein